MQVEKLVFRRLILPTNNTTDDRILVSTYPVLSDFYLFKRQVIKVIHGEDMRRGIQ